METVKLSSKGQIVIPKEIRDAKHWRTGTRLVITEVSEGLKLVSAPLVPRTRAEDGLGMLAGKRSKPMTERAAGKAVRSRARRRDEATKP